MQNEIEASGPASAAPDGDSLAKTTDTTSGDDPVLWWFDECDGTLAAELVEAVELVKKHGVGEASLRGQRILVVVDCQPDLSYLARAMPAAAALVRLVMADGEMIRPHEILVGHDINQDRGPGLDLNDSISLMRALEPQIVADFKAIEERPSKGKGDRRKPWESPYGNPGGKHHKGGHHQNLRKTLPRRGGR